MNDQTIAMAIQPDGTINVQEVLNVDFVDENGRHGIFRTIQTRFDYNPDPKFERIYPISDVQVEASNGASGKNEISDDGRFKVFKIGDGDRLVTGKVTYTITYKLKGALNRFADHDELYWNAVGFDWQMPIGATTVHVTAPSGMTRGQLLHRTRRLDACPATATSSTPTTSAIFRQGPLYPGSGMTVLVALKKGVVSAAGLEPDPR